MGQSTLHPDLKAALKRGPPGSASSLWKRPDFFTFSVLLSAMSWGWSTEHLHTVIRDRIK